ncbi:serine/threonine-protein kinase BLUS1 [Populus alba]|uniref:Serine/threonine-protein kinase BLUS1-like n=2 Tax=Populus TaxID=3689 RepID=A0A4U5NKN3_POPAL|nr:serine/threonine-protein kinase BLUS1-like [Populus alba]KAJ6968066.1 serine/threonine-protein kinase BLUS1-like [Populus alba x Populus x berolinensis]TKR84137.1 serine/threonine-protein kinase BLUS1-like [Populus alba]
MADELDQESEARLQYPTDPTAYRLLEEIGGTGSSATVHKAICIHNISKSTFVAIRIFDLEQYPADFDGLRRETKTMLLHSHPNVLASHLSFAVDRYLWVVMPYMSAGSLQPIISSHFPDGLPELSIAIILKETLQGLCYIHDQGRIHTDIKAGNILIDTENGSIKLADRGKSVSIYDLRSVVGSSPLSPSSRMRLTDVAGTPYWMAPEVIHDLDAGYSLKADIWSFGITALEIAYGRPPFSDLPPSKSLIMKINKRLGFSNYHEEKHKKDFKNKKFSKEFKDMVASCLDQDPSKRPSADQLLEYSFFKNCRGLDFLIKKVFDGLPNVEDTFKELKALQGTPNQITAGTDVEEEEERPESVGPSEKTRWISGWKLNEYEFNLVPEFSSDSEDDSFVKMVRFGGETIIPDTNIGFSVASIGSSDLEGSVEDHTGENMSGIEGIVEDFNQERIVLEGLMALKRSLDEQRRQVASIITLLGGEADGEEQLVQRIENLKRELDLEKEKNLKLEMELENIKIVISGANNDASSAAAADDDDDDAAFDDID